MWANDSGPGSVAVYLMRLFEFIDTTTSRWVQWVFFEHSAMRASNVCEPRSCFCYPSLLAILSNSWLPFRRRIFNSPFQSDSSRFSLSLSPLLPILIIYCSRRRPTSVILWLIFKVFLVRVHRSVVHPCGHFMTCIISVMILLILWSRILKSIEESGQNANFGCTRIFVSRDGL